MNANCPNFSNKQVKKEFDELVDIFGEDTAYFLWDKNEGYSLDKAPNGADSSLFQSLLNNYEGDRVKALVEAAKQLISNDNEVSTTDNTVTEQEEPKTPEQIEEYKNKVAKAKQVLDELEKKINEHTDEVIQKQNTIQQEISRQFNILARAYQSSPVKTKSRQKIENRVAITISRLQNASDIDAANLAIEQAALSIGFTNEDTYLNGKPKLYKWLYDGYNTNFKNMNSNQLVDAYKNSLKFYDTLLNNISKWYNFSNKDIQSKINNSMLDQVIKSINNCNQLWVKAIQVVGDREIDKYTDEIVDYPDSQKDAFKTNAKDWLHYNIFNYDIGGIEKNLGNYGSNGSQIIRMAMDIIKSSDLKTKKESIIMLNGIADAYKKFNKGIRHFETKSQDIFMEKDESGNYTGYFVRPLNYGQYYKNLNDFVSELNDKFDKEFGHHYIVQQGDNAIINSLTGEYAEDELWGNTGNDEDDMPVYYKYQLAINEWKGQNCERRYKPKYYAERMSRPFSETDKNGKINHGLSPKALFRYNRIQNRINYYLDIKLDKDTGISHPEKLDPEDQQILDDLYEQLDDLACPFEKDNINIRKEEEDYKIALEIKAWQKYINKENTKNINWKEFNKEREIAKSENNEYNFLKYNASWGINEDLIDKVFGKFKDADDTVGSVLAGMLKQGLNSLVKVQNTIYKNLSKYDNNIDFYLSCKEADEYIDEHRNKQDKEAVELYNEYFQTKEQPYFDMAGNRYFRGKNENDEYVKIPASVNADYDALLTHFDYMVAKYTDIARNQGFIEGVANDDGSIVDFTNMTDQQIMDYVEGLFTYEKHYTDKNGNEVTKKVPLSIFQNMTPKTNKIDGVDTILYNPRGRFAEKNGPFFNENYNKNDLDKQAEQPIKSKYDNSKAFNKMSKDQDALNLYNQLIDVMKKSHSNYSAKYTAFNYKLPQIDAKSSSILSRTFKKGIVKGVVNTSKELWNRMFNVNENDEAFRTQQSMQTSPDGSTNTSLPLRYVSPLKDPSNIGTNISSMVAQFANMSINYRNKQEILPKLQLFQYNLDQQIREQQSEFGKNDQYNLGENQKQAYKNLLDTHVYENNPVNTNSKLYTFLYRLGRKSISILTLNTLGFNVNSAEAGFEDGLYRQLQLAIQGKYFNIKDFISSIAYCTPMLFKTITNYGNVIANNKLQRMMQEYGVSSQIKESIKALGVSKLRKIAGGILMGWFEMTDYISNSIFLKSFCNQIRFYNGDKVAKGFYSSYQLQLAFINAGLSAKEAKKAHRWLKTNVWNAYSYDGNGNLSIKPEYQQYITQKLQNAIFGSAGEKIAWINGTNQVGDTPLYRRSITGMLIGGMRGAYAQNAQQQYFGRYDNIVRKIKSIQKETIENGKTSRRYKVEFEPLTDEQRAIASSYSFNTGQPMDQSFRASYTALCKTARMLGRVIRIKQSRNIKYSRVEKQAVIGLFITLVAMSLQTLGYRYVKDWADEVPNPKNKQEASDYNFRKQVQNIYIRRLVMGWSPLNIAELGEIINSITVYKNPTQNFVGILDYLKAGYQDDPDHANSDIISRGSYKYYTHGERRLMSAIGPINNIHNSFSNQGNAAITRFNENIFGGAIELAGIKLKHKKSKTPTNSGGSSIKSEFGNEGFGNSNGSEFGNDGYSNNNGSDFGNSGY